MDLLSDYKPLSSTKVAEEVEEDRNQALNILNVTYMEALKIKRLLSGRLTHSNLTFMESFENPELESEQIQREKEGVEQAGTKKKVEIENQLSFSLITKSHLPDYEILINFSINIKRVTIDFESKILKNYRLLRIESRNLVRFMAKYFLSYNGRLRQGSFYVNPITGEISLFIHNHSTINSISEMIRNPQKFLVFVMFYIDQITTKWNECLDTVLYLINKKSYEEINPSKKFKYVKEKMKRLGQMIIHSHLDASFFIQNRGIPRFQKIDEEERKHRVASLKNEYNSMEKKSKPLQAINPIIKIFVGVNKMSQAQFKFTPLQMPQIREFSQNLACHEYGGRSIIYSEIQIFNVLHEALVFKSGFSQIYQIQAQINRIEQNTLANTILIKKKTQQKRYKNEVSVLQLIQKEKFLFLPRYYFCQQEEHKESIFIEFIHESSLDRYLMTKSMFMGTETKLFFLFMVIIALRFLRDNSIVHIDLKPENVLIKIVGDTRQSFHYLAKLIDFGESYSPKINFQACRGFTIPYASPELLSKKMRFDEKADVYSFGVMMFKILFDHFPLEVLKLSKTDFIEEKYLKFYSIPYERLQSFGMTEIMSLLYYLSLKCLHPNSCQRPTLDWLCIIFKDIILTYDEISK